MGQFGRFGAEIIRCGRIGADTIWRQDGSTLRPLGATTIRRRPFRHQDDPTFRPFSGLNLIEYDHTIHYSINSFFIIKTLEKLIGTEFNIE